MTTKKSKNSKAGRPAYEPSKEVAALVQVIAGLNGTQQECWEKLEMSKNTFKKYYLEDWRKGSRIKERLVGKLLQRALEGHTAELIFACKSVAGLREKQHIEHSGEIGRVEQIVIPGAKPLPDFPDE